MAPDSPPWSDAAAPIWALVCGYAHQARLDKPLAFLQAFADDSASEIGDLRLFVAGYLDRAETWAAFSDAWESGLKEAPGIAYLKMTEANFFDGEFRGWGEDARNKKLLRLAKIIRDFAPVSFRASLNRKLFFDHLKTVAPRGIGQPHFVCTFLTTSGVAQYSASKGNEIPIEFIFDRQDGVSDDFDLFFEFMKRNLPETARRLIVNQPVFRDDKLVRPLQASDMLAWHLRRQHEKGKSEPGRAEIVELLCGGRDHVVTEVPDDYVIRWAEFFGTMPELAQVVSKNGWREIKRQIRGATALPYIPPYDQEKK